MQLGAAVGVGILTALWFAPLLSQPNQIEEERLLLRAALKAKARKRTKAHTDTTEKSSSDSDTESESESESDKVRYLTNMVKKLRTEKRKRGSKGTKERKHKQSLKTKLSTEEAEDWGTHLTNHHTDVVSGDWEGFSMEDARKHNEMIGAASKLQTPRDVLGELQVWCTQVPAFSFSAAVGVTNCAFVLS